MAKASKIARKAKKLREKVKIQAAKKMGKIEQKIAKSKTKEKIRKIRKGR